MKRSLIGVFLSLVGSIWAIAILLAGATYVPNVNEWSTPPGRYLTGIIEMGLIVPLVVGVLLLVLGLVILAIEFFKKEN